MSEKSNILCLAGFLRFSDSTCHYLYCLSLFVVGFCVINNDRARVLHTDCERVVLLFAEQPYSEQGLKLPAAKRQRVDAVTLDLSRVKEAETFDWTQTPLGEDLLERLGPVERLPEPQEATGWAIGMMPAMPSLIEELPAFPEVPMAEVPAPEGAPPAAPEGAAAAPDADALDLFGGDLELPELPELPEAEKKRRRRLPPPGHVLGFDEKITAEVAEAQVPQSWPVHSFMNLNDVSHTTVPGSLMSIALPNRFVRLSCTYCAV